MPKNIIRRRQKIKRRKPLNFMYYNPINTLKPVNLLQSQRLFKFNSDRTDFDFSVKYFSYLQSSSITSFFSTCQVDLPVCFKKSFSLFYKSFQIPVLKFLNIFMRDGCRLTVTRVVSKALNYLSRSLKLYTASSTKDKWWLLWYLLQTPTFERKNRTKTYLLRLPPFLNYGENVINPTKTQGKPNYFSLPNHRNILDNLYRFNPKLLTKYRILDKFDEYNPVFSFYVQKVDKSVRKYSRGKSGKYTLTWKYVPLYKRKYVAMRWFFKDVRFNRSKKFEERFFKSMNMLHYNSGKMFMDRCKKFNHIHVFQKHKRSLLKTLKSTS